MFKFDTAVSVIPFCKFQTLITVSIISVESYFKAKETEGHK